VTITKDAPKFCISICASRLPSLFTTPTHPTPNQLPQSVPVSPPYHYCTLYHILKPWQLRLRLRSRYDSTSATPLCCCPIADTAQSQASSDLANLKMVDSPAKKLTFDHMDKENLPANIPTPIMDDLAVKKPITEIFDEKKKEISVVAPTIKSLEADEPLLQENPHRFVLFPIKYHEVRVCPARHALSAFPSPLLTLLQPSDMANV